VNLALADDTPACTICRTALYDDEISQQACRRCVRTTDEHLLALAGPRGLYAQLDRQLVPGSRTADVVVSGGQATAPVPVSLEVLDLLAVGGAVTILQSWVEVWAEHGRAQANRAGTMQQQLDAAIGTLRFNLDWAATSAPAFGDFAHEVYKLRRRCERQITQEPPATRIPVRCPCGTILRFTISTPGTTCHGCGTRYGRDTITTLPLAHGAAA
jgi:hypothetical protein